MSAILIVEEERQKGAHGESEELTKRIKEGAGAKAEGRDVLANGNVFHLRGQGSRYGDDSWLENNDIGLENEYLWNVFPARSVR